MAEKKYIEREEALLEIEEWADTFCECDYVWPHVIKSIRKLPAADVRPVVRGKWISQRDGETVVKLMYGEPICSCFCSVCREWLVASDEYVVKGNFCPNCGADMREES